MRLAKILTLLGVQADIAYFLINMAMWFWLSGMVVEALVCFAAGSATIYWLVSVGRRVAVTEMRALSDVR